MRYMGVLMKELVDTTIYKTVEGTFRFDVLTDGLSYTTTMSAYIYNEDAIDDTTFSITQIAGILFDPFESREELLSFYHDYADSGGYFTDSISGTREYILARLAGDETLEFIELETLYLEDNDGVVFLS